MTPEAEAVLIEGYRSGRSVGEIAEELSYHPSWITETASRLRKEGVTVPLRTGKAPVPLVPFQDRFEQMNRDGGAALVIATRLGWRARGWLDTNRVRRTLGVRPQDGVYRQTVSYDTAERLAEAMGLQLWEVGL